MLPIFQGRSGYSPIFITGDLVAGAIVKALKDTCGISIKKFANHSVGIGKICNETSWAELNTSTLVLILNDGDCFLIPAKQKPIITNLSVAVPLAPLMEILMRALQRNNGQAQHPLYFPLSEVGSQSYKVSSS